jgi:hypothetical protein
MHQIFIVLEDLPDPERKVGHNKGHESVRVGVRLYFK